jgi:lipopolysaccharide/colanic/teichoic acid biosynthesis glycosyltransferase
MVTSTQSAFRDAELAPDLTLEASSWSLSRGKRVFDAIVAAIGLVVLVPVMLVIALLIKCTSRGPVFFHQLRVGQHGTEFKLFKFRTMTNLAGLSLTRKGDRRVTAFGRFLRRTKLDELPQLINILFGDMSFVGPRPDLPEFWSSLTGLNRHVMKLRPGLTGCASLQFRDEEDLLASIPEDRLNDYYLSNLLPLKVQIDLDYARRASFFSDLRLLFATVFSTAKSARLTNADRC